MRQRSETQDAAGKRSRRCARHCGARNGDGMEMGCRWDEGLDVIGREMSSNDG